MSEPIVLSISVKLAQRPPGSLLDDPSPVQAVIYACEKQVDVPGEVD